MKLLPIFLVVLVSATVSHALVVMVPKVDSETSVDSKAEPKVEVTEDAKDKAKDEVKDQTKDETKDEAESKTESKDKYWGPYGNDDYDGYGYYGRWRYNCRFCYYGNCPYYCYNYPMSEAVRPASTIPEYVANEAKVVVGTDASDKGVHYGYGYRPDAWDCICDPYYGCNCNDFPYQNDVQSLAETDSKTKTDSKDKWYPYGNRYCYYYPQFCGGMYGGGYGDYPFQSLAKTDSKVETDSKDKWYPYGNRYCDYYPEYCNYGGMYGGGYGGYYPYQAESLATIDSKASTKSKGKYWYPYGNRYCRYNPQFCYGGMYGGGYGGYYPY